MFPNYIWNMPKNEKCLYLTFDDGPTPEITPWTLELLKSYNAKATFFCTGNNIEQYPQIFDSIIKEGHVVGNHTYSHPQGWTTNGDSYVDQVVTTQSNIERRIADANDKIQSAPYPKLFRPPYGKITPQQGKRLMALDFKIIMWDILSFDWKASLTPDQCADNVISKAGNGSIIVFHDSEKASKNMKWALAKTLEHFSGNGFEFRSIDPILS